jgi:hypothetical protein
MRAYSDVWVANTEKMLSDRANNIRLHSRGQVIGNVNRFDHHNGRTSYLVPAIQLESKSTHSFKRARFA